MLQVTLLLVFAAAGVVALACVMFYGSTRRRRMAEFVRERGGSWSLYDDFDLQSEIDALFERGEWWVGASGYIPGPGVDAERPRLYLIDLHPEPESPPTRTTALLKRDSADGPPPYLVRERMPGAGGLEGEKTPQFDLVEGEPPETFLSRVERLPEGRDWLLEARSTASRTAVSARDRPLSNRREWEQLLEVAETLRRLRE